MYRVYILDGINEDPRRGLGGEGDHRREKSFPPGEWEKGMPWKTS